MHENAAVCILYEIRIWHLDIMTVKCIAKEQWPWSKPNVRRTWKIHVNASVFTYCHCHVLSRGGVKLLTVVFPYLLTIFFANITSLEYYGVGLQLSIWQSSQTFLWDSSHFLMNSLYLNDRVLGFGKASEWKIRALGSDCALCWPIHHTKWDTTRLVGQFPLFWCRTSFSAAVQLCAQSSMLS